MRACGPIAVVLVGLGLAACDARELDDARAIVEAEDREATARRELVRLERELAAATDTDTKRALETQLAAQRERVRAAEIEARKRRIQRRQ